VLKHTEVSLGILPQPHLVEVPSPPVGIIPTIYDAAENEYGVLSCLNVYWEAMSAFFCCFPACKMTYLATQKSEEADNEIVQVAILDESGMARAHHKKHGGVC
jgi:hypothetical protein